MDHKIPETEERTVVPTSNKIVMPVVSKEEAVAAWNQYVDLKKAITEKSDVQVIADKEFLKKSYWRKINKFFNLSLKKIDESEKVMKALIRTIEKKRKNKKTNEWFITKEKEVEYYPFEAELTPAQNEIVKLTIVFSATYRAQASNGAFADGDGHCDTWEKGYANSYHNAKATSHTRAKNRAISDLVGGGEVSAEEIVGEFSQDNFNGSPDTESDSEIEKNAAHEKELERCETLEDLEQTFDGFPPKVKTALFKKRNQLKNQMKKNGGIRPTSKEDESIEGQEGMSHGEPTEAEGASIVIEEALKSIPDYPEDPAKAFSDCSNLANELVKYRSKIDESIYTDLKAQIDRKLSALGKLAKKKK